MNNTSTHSPVTTEGLNALKAMLETVQKGKVPFIWHHPFCSDGSVYYGEFFDKLSDKEFPQFNPKIHKAFIAPESLRETLVLKLRQGFWPFVYMDEEAHP